MGTKPACTRCGTVHASNMAYAVGRFTGRPSYVADVGDYPVRSTRGAAESDACAYYATVRANTTTDSGHPFHFTLTRKMDMLVSWNTPDALGHVLIRSRAEAEEMAAADMPGNVSLAASAYLELFPIR